VQNADRGVRDGATGSRGTHSGWLLTSYLVFLLAVAIYLAQLFPFNKLYVPIDSYSIVVLLLVLACFSLIIPGTILVIMGRFPQRGRALILFVSVVVTLASTSHTIAAGAFGFCDPGITSYGFPFPWYFRRELFVPGFGRCLPRCGAPANPQFQLPLLAPLFFAFDTIFYFATSLVILQFYASLVNPIIARVHLRFTKAQKRRRT
jgi:hypothetical protein